MGRMLIVCGILVSSLAGCSGLTLGPTIEKKLVVVRAGTAIEVTENTTVKCRLLTPADGKTDIFEQDIGGWVMMHPDHWETLRSEFKRLQIKCGEAKGPPADGR